MLAEAILPLSKMFFALSDKLSTEHAKLYAWRVTVSVFETGMLADSCSGRSKDIAELRESPNKLNN